AFSELGVLRQKTVARMNRFGAGSQGSFDDLLDSQIRILRRGRAEMNGLAGEADVRRMGVGVGIDGHRLDAHRVASAHHAQRYLATVSDQNFAKRTRLHLCRAVKPIQPFQPLKLRVSFVSILPTSSLRPSDRSISLVGRYFKRS